MNKISFLTDESQELVNRLLEFISDEFRLNSNMPSLAFIFGKNTKQMQIIAGEFSSENPGAQKDEFVKSIKFVARRINAYLILYVSECWMTRYVKDEEGKPKEEGAKDEGLLIIIEGVGQKYALTTAPINHTADGKSVDLKDIKFNEPAKLAGRFTNMLPTPDNKLSAEDTARIAQEYNQEVLSITP